MDASPDQTPALLERWHRGDEAALSMLLELHIAWLRAHAEKRTGDILKARGNVDDYVQDAVLDFLRDAPRFQVRDGGQFRALLARVLENTLRDRRDWFRAKRRDLARDHKLPTDSVLPLDPALQRSTTPSREAGRAEIRDWVRLGLEMLGGEDRKILLAREYEDRSFVEIGAELGMSANAVRMRWVRALERLAKMMQTMRNGDVPDEPAG
ncbi:MAG: sigma-70 family RNA polymerase sigma factor [Planctomycetes bacterium]|nr:sigma-70 family RNA polymerase sigma factor [Planctomycetota bacterium]